MTELQRKTEKLKQQNDQLRDECSALQKKGASDQRAVLTVHRILEERQLEYAGLRKQYTLVESAIRGTAYVEEI